MECPKVAIFDLDDTLAESFKAPTPEMVQLLARLLELMPVSILTAAGFPRIEREFLDSLAVSPYIGRMYVFSNSASQCYIHENAWRPAYDLALSTEDRAAITKAVEESVAETGIIEPHPKYQPRIIDRETQIAYAAIGLDASEEDKAKWDPDQTKRKKLKEAIERRLSNFEVLIGGKTTIDITSKGVNKAYGVRWLSEYLNIPASEMLYVGDALYEGGNDAVVIPTGIKTIAVKGPQDTKLVIEELLATCAA